MLCEINQISSRVAATLMSPQTRIPLWPPIYLVYRSLDDVLAVAKRANESLNELQGDKGIKEQRDLLDYVNTSFESLDNEGRKLMSAIAVLARDWVRWRLVSAEDIAFYRSHFHQKGVWFDEFCRTFRSLQVSDSGIGHHSTVKLCVNAPWRIEEQHLIQFDLVSRWETGSLLKGGADDHVRERLQVQISEMLATRDQIGSVIEARCSLADLLVTHEVPILL